MSRFPSDWFDSDWFDSDRSFEAESTLATEQLVRMACTIEAAAPKPGNVHPGASFDDVTFASFVASANAIEPVFADSGKRRVGAIVLDAVVATRAAVGSNTNLGMILLLAPLAAVPRDVVLQDGIVSVLASLGESDCRDVYAAIAAAQAGGMGKVDDADLAAAAPKDLVAAMRLAADRDLIARQYTNSFADVLGFVTPTLFRFAASERLDRAIVRTHLATMAEYPDSLIQRKCGADLAAESAERARRLLESSGTAAEYASRLKEFDEWLRADGNRRNPGTTADLIAAADGRSCWRPLVANSKVVGDLAVIFGPRMMRSRILDSNRLSL